MICILKMNGKFGALSDKEEPSSEKIAYCTLFFWISICDREHSSEKLTFFFTDFFPKVLVTSSYKKVVKKNAMHFLDFSTKLLATFMERFLREGRFQCRIDAGSYRISLRSTFRIN